MTTIAAEQHGPQGFTLIVADSKSAMAPVESVSSDLDHMKSLPFPGESHQF